jgi:outer membrane protease
MRRMRAVRALSLPALFLAGLLTGPSAFGQGATLTVRTGTGIMYGTSRELVLDGSFAVSELDWAIQPVFYVESVLELRALGGLAVSLSVRNGIPAQSGFITDSDWLNYPMNTDKTNFSQHDCYTERAVLVDARAGWEFSLGDVLAIQPFGAFEFMSYKWTARDGYLQYPRGCFSASACPPAQPSRWMPPIGASPGLSATRRRSSRASTTLAFLPARQIRRRELHTRSATPAAPPTRCGAPPCSSTCRCSRR